MKKMTRARRIAAPFAALTGRFYIEALRGYAFIL
jgi:hypothetical protein